MPELSAAGQEDQSNAIAIGKLESFHLAVKHDELLSQYRVFGDQVGAAASHVGEGANDKIWGDRFSPLFGVPLHAADKPFPGTNIEGVNPIDLGLSE